VLHRQKQRPRPKRQLPRRQKQPPKNNFGRQRLRPVLYFFNPAQPAGFFYGNFFKTPCPVGPATIRAASIIFAGMKFLIAGLGNAGAEYANTRHNIGFDVAGAFVQKHGGSFETGRLAYVATVRWKGKVFICICPTTFMNLSGRAVKYWMAKPDGDPRRSGFAA
jgi:hypothetical protein